ncbi:EAL domain-containing protein [Lacticaseibacillus zhaodongensis]|uniref:EAL domain-containing protein n=1 Tax=Lacticaseibacillus zhaodongensis TaxID=2668065 RepID=UPI0012D2F7EF|nr:EAL domain-containing protein [Lacticaseibacillus zhaodongensis]
MYRFFGQPKFCPTDYDKGPIGYELFLREKINNQWRLPENFEAISGEIFAELLQRTILSLPASTEMISFNLEQSHFVNATYLKMVKRIQGLTSIHLYTELTERNIDGVNVDQLRSAAQQYYNSRLSVVLDDVGTAENNDDTVTELNAYVDEYKFALQNLRPFASIDDIRPIIDHWWRRAKDNNKLLAIEGIETQEEFQTIVKDYPSDIVQGYYLGKPAIIPINKTLTVSPRFAPAEKWCLGTFAAESFA